MRTQRQRCPEASWRDSHRLRWPIVVLHNARVIGLDQITFSLRKLLAEIEGVARGLLRLGVVSERGIGFGQTEKAMANCGSSLMAS